jgi:hypothetical protein
VAEAAQVAGSARRERLESLRSRLGFAIELFERALADLERPKPAEPSRADDRPTSSVE